MDVILKWGILIQLLGYDVINLTKIKIKKGRGGGRFRIETDVA